MQCHLIIMGGAGIVDSSEVLGLPFGPEIGAKVGTEGETGVTAA